MKVKLFMKPIKIFLVAALLFSCVENDIVNIRIKEGVNKVTLYEELTLNTCLQVYMENSNNHLSGDAFLDVKDEDKDIASFYVNSSGDVNEYSTIIYKNYFLTFLAFSDKYNLIVEHSKFGKAFALSDKGSCTIGNELELKITNFYYEWGCNSPLEDESSRYDDVNYTIKLKSNEQEKDFCFYSSELNDNYTIDFGNYKIYILSDQYLYNCCYVEMKVINISES